MSDEIFLGGVSYVPARAAAQEAGLSADYLTTFCRDGKIRSERLGKQWYVEKSSLHAFLIEREFTASQRKERLAHGRKCLMPRGV